MPIYEFRCTACAHRFERWQKMADPDPDRCPECEQQAVERVISAVGFRLKGSGWYETDFKKSGRHNIAGGGKESEADTKKTDVDKKDEAKKSPASEKSATKSDAPKTTSKKSDAAL